MEELTLHSDENELVAAIHGGMPPPLPFERDIFLLGIEIAGTNHAPDIERLYDLLQEGDRVRLVREPENPYDEYAIRIDTENGDPLGYLAPDPTALAANEKLGYIPRYTNKVFARLMDAGKYLYAVIRHKEIVGSYRKIVIKIFLKD